MELLKINRQRLLETIAVSASIGTTANGGLHRLALTEEDRKMREQFITWLKEAKLEVRVDDFGNIYGRRNGRINDGPVLALGSHLDTQPCGGKYDGVLGVLAALEVIRVLNENDIKTELPIEIINFTNEEGARFTPPMLASGGIAKEFSKEYIYKRKDESGTTFREALQNIGFLGEEKNRIHHVKHFIELHVEQGPILEKENKSIGIVKGIQGNNWITVKVIGQTNHAGPTPMEHRRDALVAAAKMIVKINELAKETRGLKTTVGKIHVIPNVTNVIPGEVEFSVDIRHEDNETRMYALERMKEQLSIIALLHHVEIHIATEWHSDTVEFSPVVIQTIKEAANRLNYTTMEMYSGPGHDAKYMAMISESGMIFIPSINGVSHNERELSLDIDIEKGANVLLHVTLQLAKANNFIKN